jgi:hypothetical protein
MIDDTFAVTSGSPQHETDPERESRCHRCNRALRDQCLDMIFLLAQGLAEFIQGGLGLVGEGVGAALAASNAPSPVLFKRRDTSL